MEILYKRSFNLTEVEECVVGGREIKWMRLIRVGQAIDFLLRAD